MGGRPPGRLSLTKEGLRRRDRMVLSRLDAMPVCVVLAGGYAEDVNDTVEINLGTVHEAMRRFEERDALQRA